ncbi:hypothetical protein MKS95_001378 [Campylobacter jejuni]|nr:hypothetical protein [Campylobacter jejuni]EAL9374710.1 hypothetical protein [Campylobacter jejuni]EAL9420522.1 hypothetical protein [Campylobacter jejuni]EFN0435045.1 hypothetical protein [Campylobacter jejuni]EGQ2557573.1 hypothetical protein [Campylobacter jejuni]
MKRGFAKIEFFANLEYLKQEYNKGYVVSKILYKKAKQDKNISMVYSQFNKYFNEVFKNKIEKKEITQENNQSSALENKEPIKLKINTKSKKVFDAKFGKDIKEDDLL